jgi:hypothetical protein
MTDILPIKIQVFQHSETGLLMAIGEDLPGFIVHAHSKDEMRAKLVPAYNSYLRALGQADEEGVELTDKTIPGFWPPVFEIRRAASKAAA